MLVDKKSKVFAVTCLAETMHLNLWLDDVPKSPTGVAALIFRMFHGIAALSRQ